MRKVYDSCLIRPQKRSRRKPRLEVGVFRSNSLCNDGGHEAVDTHALSLCLSR